MVAVGNADAGLDGLPDIKISARKIFGVDTDLEVPAFSKRSEHVPEIGRAHV